MRPRFPGPIELNGTPVIIHRVAKYTSQLAEPNTPLCRVRQFSLTHHLNRRSSRLDRRFGLRTRTSKNANLLLMVEELEYEVYWCRRCDPCKQTSVKRQTDLYAFERPLEQ